MSRRGKIEIYMDILEAVQDRDRATNIAHKARLNFIPLQRFLEDLTERGLIKLYDGTKLYEITEHGRTLLKHWNKILEMLL